MLLLETARLIQKYPLSVLAVGAAAVLALPVAAVVTAGALRPWARRVLWSSAAIRREAGRIAAESREAYADLLAEADPPLDGAREERVESASPAPQKVAAPRSQRPMAEAA
jgi:hypothetical protein